MKTDGLDTTEMTAGLLLCVDTTIALCGVAELVRETFAKGQSIPSAYRICWQNTAERYSSERATNTTPQDFLDLIITEYMLPIGVQER